MWEIFATNDGMVAAGDPLYRRVYLINSILFILLCTFSFFTVADFIVGYEELALNNFIGFCLSFFVVVYFRKTRNVKIASYAVVAVFSVVCVSFISAVKPHYYSYYWLAIFAPVAFFLLGSKKGAILSAAFYGYFIVDMWANIGAFEPSPFGFEAVLNIAAAIAALVAITRYFEISRKEAAENLRRANEELQERVKEEVEKRMATEAERQKEREIFIQNEKMAQFGNMLGVILHQWKQPLSSIALCAHELKMSVGDGSLTNENVNGAADLLLENVYFMSATADEFGNFYKPSKNKKIFSAAAQIGNIQKLLQKQLSKSSVTINLNAQPSITVFGHEGEFKQVVLNIINNAKEALEERKIERPTIDINVKSEKGKAIIEFCDNAGGIDESLLPRKIFDMFSSTKGDKGTGVGLGICRIIIEENMSGSISAANGANGAIFRIELPLAS